jgi:hypothetical protein
LKEEDAFEILSAYSSGCLVADVAERQCAKVKGRILREVEEVVMGRESVDVKGPT